MDTFIKWWLKTLWKQRIVMAVYASGEQKIRVVRTTDGGKSYVASKGKKVGFLDNPAQKEGEFRKGVSDENMVRWFTL